MEQSTEKCSVELCSRAQQHVGLCGAHYQRRRSGRPLTIRPSEILCAGCPALVLVSNHGPVPEYCSDCRRERKSELSKASRVAPPMGRVCAEPGCSEVLHRSPGRRGARLCEAHSVARIKARKRVADPDNHDLECSELGCDRSVRARGVCSMHYKRMLRAEGKLREPWNDRRRSNHHARRARMNGAANADRVMLADLISRDALVCHWCQEAIDLDVQWPDPLSKSIDHIVPVSKGGAHTLENCQLMHLGCNSSKGDRLAA